jgi:hypothetical protein
MLFGSNKRLLLSLIKNNSLSCLNILPLTRLTTARTTSTFAFDENKIENEQREEEENGEHQKCSKSRSSAQSKTKTSKIEVGRKLIINCLSKTDEIASTDAVKESHEDDDNHSNVNINKEHAVMRTKILILNNPDNALETCSMRTTTTTTTSSSNWGKDLYDMETLIDGNVMISRRRRRNRDNDNNNSELEEEEEVVLECRIPPRFVSLDVVVGNDYKAEVIVDASVAEASVDVRVVNEPMRSRTDYSNNNDKTNVRFLKSVKGAFLTVETLGGDVFCDTVQANAIINTNGGNFVAKKIVSNEIRISTGSGKIDIDSVFVHDSVFETNGGEITARKNFRASGRTELISKGGNVSLENIECGDEDATLLIDARRETENENENDDIKNDTSSSRRKGDISLHFAPLVTKINAYTNSGGSIKCKIPRDFPATVIRREINREDEIIVPENTASKEEELSTTNETRKKNSFSSLGGARIVHDRQDQIARKLLSELERSNEVVLSSNNGSISLSETSWLDQVLFSGSR